MPNKKNKSVDEKIEELEQIDLDKVELKELGEFEAELKNKKPKKNKKEKVDEKTQLTDEQKEIVKLKSQLMQEKIKNVGGKKQKNFITKKKKRTFRDTTNDSNATTMSILKGAGLMVFAFGMLALLILIIRH